MTDVPITFGTGQASVATERIGNRDFQIIKVVGGEVGSTSVWGINPDRSAQVSVVGTVSVTLTGNPSISGTVGASVIGSVPVKGTQAVGATLSGPPVQIGGVDIYGSVVGQRFAPDGDAIVNLHASVISYGDTAPNQAAVPIGLNDQAFITFPGFGYNFNGTSWDRIRGNATNGQLVYGSVSGATNISGSVLLGSSNASVITVFQSSSVIGVVTGSVVAIPTGNQSVSGAVFVSGSVLAQQTGTVITSIVSSIPSSVLVGASIFGQLPAGTAVLGSVATLQGTTPWINTNVGSIITTQIGSVITVFKDSSILAVPVGSVITVWKDSSVLSVPVGSTIAVFQAASIVGTYAEDAAHSTGDKGIFMLGVRNDTMASTTSADGDYTQWATGPVGEGVVANSPITKWVQGTADLRGAATLGASAIAIAAGGASVFTYITGVQVANMGSASVLVTLASGGSILAYTIAPAGGGSNIVYPNALKTPANFGFAASISGVASVLVSAQGFISKT